MLGSCTSGLDEKRELYLILELCDYGDLKQYLIQNKKKILSGEESQFVKSRCLILWSYDIAQGMQYLSANKIMHGDLAARNILLDGDPLQRGYLVARIADFGLSKKFYENVKYEKEARLFVPWKWMPFEYLKNDFLTLKSDVWSYGVLLWEIMSFGRIPYGHLDYNEILEKLEDGYRLTCPVEIKTISSWSPETLYQNASKTCFVEDLEERGTFSDILRILEEELWEEEKMCYKEMEESYQQIYAKTYLNLRQTL